MQDSPHKPSSLIPAPPSPFHGEGAGGQGPNRRRKYIIIKILILFLFFFVKSTHASEAAGSTYEPGIINKDIVQGIELLYDRKFDQAENLFRKVIAEMPEEPIGYFYLAMVTWSRLAAGFWTSETVGQYGKRIDRTIAVAEKKIDMREADSLTYLYLGGALGFKGRFQLMKREWISSFFLALKAIDALKTCHRMDPNNRDVFFGLGVFDYYTDKLSGVLKFLFYLFHKGNKEEGLRKLHIAADEAVYSAVEAKSMLLHVYLFLEHRYRKALTLAEELAGRFRNDPRNKFLQGVSHLQLGMNREYRKVIGYLHKRGQEAASPEQASSWNNWALYLEASYDLFHSQISRARSKLETILSVADAEEEPFMIAWPLVKIGMSYDLEGDRDKALEYYSQVLEMENGAGAQFLALKYRDRPAKKRDPFLCY